MYKETEINNKLEIFRERLKELRGNSRLQDVAKDIGISRASLGYYENGDRKPDIEILMKLADYYHVSSDYLLGISDVKRADITTQGMVLKTGLSENVINRLCYYNERMNEYTKVLDIVLQSSAFQNALHHISKYMPAVKVTHQLHKQIIERYENVLNAEPDCGTAHNWPYNDDLEKEHKEKEEKMFLQEYLIDKAFKNLIEDLGEKAKTE